MVFQINYLSELLVTLALKQLSLIVFIGLSKARGHCKVLFTGIIVELNISFITVEFFWRCVAVFGQCCILHRDELNSLCLSFYQLSLEFE